MEGWKTEKFKKLIDYKSGYTWSKEQELAVEEPNSIRVLTVSNVQDKLDLTSELYLAGVSEQDKIKKQVSKDWSIAVSSNGNRNRIGNAIFIDSDTNYLFASFLTAFKPFDEADILPYYFYLWLSSSFVQRKITSVAEGTTGLGNLSIRFLRNMDITFPTDKAEQTAIAKILSTVDEAIRSTRETISKLERVKKSLMQNLLSGKMKPDGTLRPADEFYEDEKMGLVPKGWKCGRFKEFSVLQRGKDLTDKEVVPGKYPVVKSNGVQIWHNEYYIEPPTVVTGRSGTIGKAFYINERCWAHNTSLYVKDFKGNCPKFIYYKIWSMDFSRYFAGTTVPTLNRNDIHKLRVIMPSVEEQNQIVAILDATITKIQQKQEKITALESLKKSLMQQLLTGRVRVKE